MRRSRQLMLRLGQVLGASRRMRGVTLRIASLRSGVETTWFSGDKLIPRYNLKGLLSNGLVPRADSGFGCWGGGTGPNCEKLNNCLLIFVVVFQCPLDHPALPCFCTHLYLLRIICCYSLICVW